MQEINYDGKRIEYTLIRSKIKNMYIQIKEGKVIVKAPLKLKVKYIEEFVNKKSKWIYENLQKSKKIEERSKQEIKPEDIDRLYAIVSRNIDKYSSILKVKPNKVRIRNIKYAWGSCSTNKNITINMKLATKSNEIIEYVVLHEMCHLIHMNHSKDFWSLVENNMPEYKKYKKELKKY